MGFRLVPKSVILNDLEWWNDRYIVIVPNSACLGADYVKVVEDRPYCLYKNVVQNLVFSFYELWRYS